MAILNPDASEIDDAGALGAQRQGQRGRRWRATTRRCKPEHYFERFVGHLDERTALIVDPMLATAGSMIATVDLLKRRGCKDIRALVLVAAPEGIAALARPTPTCAAGRRRSTATSTRSATSSPAWATPATRSSVPSRRAGRVSR